jgi:hypothetical protein
MITDPFLNEFEKLTSFEVGAETQYLFCVGRDNQRNMSESQWTANVKRVFRTFSGLSPPPKLLRSSFITLCARARLDPCHPNDKPSPTRTVTRECAVFATRPTPARYRPRR